VGVYNTYGTVLYICTVQYSTVILISERNKRIEFEKDINRELFLLRIDPATFLILTVETPFYIYHVVGNRCSSNSNQSK
jgi:hypothetical protein